MCRQRTHLFLHKFFSKTSILIICAIAFYFCPAKAHAQIEVLRNLYEQAINAYQNQQYDQALRLFQQIAKAAPTFAPAYNGMALANQAAAGDENKTIEYLKTALSYDPKLTESYDNLARIYYSRGDIDQAQDYFEKALKYDPQLTSASLSLAWINLLVRSRPRTAIKYFKMVLTRSQDPKVYYGLGQAYFASNQRAGAIDMITKLHELQADDLATRLEDSLRNNAQVNTDTESSLTNLPGREPPGMGPLPVTPNEPTGTRVRLRGKLSDY